MLIEELRDSLRSTHLLVRNCSHTQVRLLRYGDTVAKDLYGRKYGLDDTTIAR